MRLSDTAAIELGRRVAGGLIAVLVVWVYVSARRHGSWPPGHPMSGLAFSLVAVQNFLPSSRKNGPSWSTVVASLAAAGLWYYSLQSVNALQSG